MNKIVQSQAWREILIVTGGLAPQVVTETIFALATRKTDPILPNKIICVVTAEAKRRFAPEFHRALTELKTVLGADVDWSNGDSPVSCALTGLFVEFPLDVDGAPVQDIGSDDDATHFADFVSEIVRLETTDLGARIHISLAGGRKTMSFHGGAAIMLFGRVQDELSHVLVHPQKFETATDFWFPSQAKQVVHDRNGNELASADGTPLKACTAEIEIALIPFARLRQRLPFNPLIDSADYASYVREINAATGRDALRLELVTESCLIKIYIGEPPKQHAVFTLGNREFALYQIMAEWAMRQKKGAGPSGVGAAHSGWLKGDWFSKSDPLNLGRVDPPELEVWTRFMEIYDDTFLDTPKARKTSEGFKYCPWRHAFDLAVFESPKRAKIPMSASDFFEQVKSNLTKTLKKNLRDSQLRAQLGAPEKSVEFHSQMVFGISLPPNAIMIRAYAE